MGRYMAVSVVVAASFGAACASDELELTQEHATLVEDTFIRGSVVHNSDCRTLGDPFVNGNSVTFILTDYTAQRDGRGQDRATCDLAVEVSLPPNTGITLDTVTYRGFADGSDARTTFRRDYHFAGQVHGQRRFTIQDYDAVGNATLVQDDSDQYTTDFGEFTASDEIPVVGPRVCGRHAVWRANTTLSVRNTEASSFSLLSIDTVDVAHQFTATFDFVPQTCR